MAADQPPTQLAWVTMELQTTEQSLWKSLRNADARLVGISSAVVISLLYVIIRPASQDFASGDFRARLFRQGSYVWNNHWFGGHPLPGYGIVSPMLSGLFGVVTVAVVSLIVASWAFGAIVHRLTLANPSLQAPLVATVLFAISCGLSLWGGRLTFGPAVAFGSISMLCLHKGRTGFALATAALCGMSSPVGALSLSLVLGACWLTSAFRRRTLVLLCAAAVLPAGIIGVIFPESGWFPFTPGGFAWLALALGGCAWFGWQYRVIRMLVGIYAAVAIAAYILRTPLGSNVVRLAWLAAGPTAVITAHRFRRTLLPAFVLFTIIWSASYVKLGFAPADATADPKYYESLAAFVLDQPGVLRVEVVPTNTFRQADELALEINIAHGWETQLDRELNPEFFDGLTSAQYHDWLLRNSVSLVALPASGIYALSEPEKAVIESNPSYLRLIWSTNEWKVYRVVNAQPLASNGATVTAVEAESLTINAPRKGVTTVRFRYTDLYQVIVGDACISESPEGWLQFDVNRPGKIVAKIGLTAIEGAKDPETCRDNR